MPGVDFRERPGQPQAQVVIIGPEPLPGLRPVPVGFRLAGPPVTVIPSLRLRLHTRQCGSRGGGRPGQ